MPLNQPGGGVVPSEAYEVYSALYQAPMQEPLVFSEDSLTDIPQVNGSCLRPTASQEQEMTDAFVAANQQSHRWEQKFSIPQGYRLLPHSELAQAQTCAATHGRDVASCESYKQLRYVRLLGVPGFDHAHTRALVSVIKSCGHLCGSGGIFAVEKTERNMAAICDNRFHSRLQLDVLENAWFLTNDGCPISRSFFARSGCPTFPLYSRRAMHSGATSGPVH